MICCTESFFPVCFAFNEGRQIHVFSFSFTSSSSFWSFAGRPKLIVSITAFLLADTLLLLNGGVTGMLVNVDVDVDVGDESCLDSGNVL